MRLQSANFLKQKPAAKKITHSENSNLEMSGEKKVKLEEPVDEPPVLLPPITFVATADGVKVEERYCSVCLATVSGEVAICPKNEHYVCAAHLKEPSFKLCPLCKTPWLKKRDHDLENNRPLDDDKRSFLLELMQDPALTLEEMKARFLQANVLFWSDLFNGHLVDHGQSRVERAALASDRNWAFFTGEWQRAVSSNMREFCNFAWSQLKLYYVLTESGRFWEWILPLYGDIVVTAMSVFYNENALDDLLKRGVVDACRVLVPYCRAKNFNMMRGVDPIKLVARWLRYSLVRAQQMCELTGLTLTAAAILEAAPHIDDAAIVVHVQLVFPEIGPALWKKVVETPPYRRDKHWDESGDLFIQEMLKFKPRGWIYTDDKPVLMQFRPILLYDRGANSVHHCAYWDWIQEGMNAPMQEGRAYRAKEMLILPNAEGAPPMEVKTLFIITFEKRNVVRMYAHEDPGYDSAYSKMRALLKDREIAPPPGTWIKFDYLVCIKYEKSVVF